MENNGSIAPAQYQSIHGWFDYEPLYNEVFSTLPEKAHIVEVGCWLGRSACYMGELIKSSGKNIRFDCIDTWRHPRTDWSDQIIKGNKESQVDDFVTNLNAGGVLQYVNILQLNSLEAVYLYEDRSLDFVFLDNDHSEQHVFDELNAWWPKIRKGGVLAGHDYIEASWPGVVNSVQRFARNRRLDILVNGNSYMLKNSKD